MLEQEAQTLRRKLDTVVVEVRPMLECIDMEATQPIDRLPRSNTIIDRCKAAWENFKSFNHDATISIATHALVVVLSHCHVISLQVIGA